MTTSSSRLEIIIDSSKAEKSLSALEGKLSQVEGRGEATAATMGRVNRVIGLLAGAFSIRQISTYADTWSDLNSRVANATGSTDTAADTLQRLSQTARSTYSSLNATAETFLANANTMRELGVSTERQLDLSDALNNSMVISSMRGQDAAIVMDALSRSFSLGELRGDALNTVLMRGDRLTQALADGLGVATSELREMGGSGTLTTERVIAALTSQMEVLRKEADAMPATLADGFTLIGNSALELVGSIDQAFGTSEGIAGMMVNAADAVRDNVGPITDQMVSLDWALRGATGAVIALTGAKYGLATATWAATTAQSAFLKVIRRNPIILAATGVTALAGAYYGARDATMEFGDTQASVADWTQGVWVGTQRTVSDAAGGMLSDTESALGRASQLMTNSATLAGAVWSAMYSDLISDARDSANGMIAYMDTFGSSVGLVAGATRDAFSNAFRDTLGLSRAFMMDLLNILSGDRSFSSFNQLRDQLADNFTAPFKEAIEQVGQISQENLNTDYLGNIAGGLSDRLGVLRNNISDAAFEARMARGEFGLVAEGFSEGTKAADGLGTGMLGLGDIIQDVSGSSKKATEDARREAEQFANSLQSLTDRLFPLEAAQRSYRDDQELLTLAWAKGEMGVMRYLEALNQLEQAQLSTKTASAVYGGGGGFGAEIGSRGGLGAPTDPLAGIAGNQDQGYWDRWLESAESAFTDFDQLSANTAENFQRGFGNAFESMIFDSESAGDAARNLFEGMGRTAINTLGQMAGQWLALQAVQLAIGKTSEAAAIGSAVTTGTAIATAYAPAAAAASLASFGTNSVPAMAGMSATYGLSSMLAMTGFADGGYTGSGGKYDPAGIVHAGEFVVRKEMVERPGVLGMLEGLNRGYANGGYVGAAPLSSISPAPSYGQTLNSDRLDAYHASARVGRDQPPVVIHKAGNTYHIQGKPDRQTIKMIEQAEERAYQRVLRDARRNLDIRQALGV
ncbi:MAG: phage tail tape measure protein [Halomonas sp.]|nr:phage tail tape measure protein [Halomonas sp.]